jgi:hypothetical protein
MSDHGHGHRHDHPHRHPAGHSHPPATVQPSILRLSGLHRLLFAGALGALIWLAVLWAIR